MRVPVMVPVGGRKIKIRYLKSLPGPSKDLVFGEFCSSGTEIRINKAAHTNSQELFKTLFHELTHAVFKISGLENIIPLNKEEAVVSAIENLMAPLYAFSPSAKIKYREIRFAFEDEE